jgi:hypothetical protein
MKEYTIIGFAIGLIWFLTLQFYWPPTTELTDIIVSAFFWPGVVLTTLLMADGFVRLYRELRLFRLRLKSHSKGFATQMYIALRRNADLSDTDFDIYTLEEVQTALKAAYSESRK